jgi:hypothetical protein
LFQALIYLGARRRIYRRISGQLVRKTLIWACRSLCRIGVSGGFKSAGDHRAPRSRIRAPSLGRLANPTARTPNTANAIRDVKVHTINFTPPTTTPLSAKRLAMAWRTMGKIAAQCANNLPAAVRRAVAERQAGLQRSQRLWREKNPHLNGAKLNCLPWQSSQLSSAKVVLLAGRE